MSETDPFRVLVKQSAVDRNSAVAARVSDPPAVLEFTSKTAAQSEAATLTREGDGPVRVQAVAPQDDTDADAYLVGASRSGTDVPETPPSAGWTFGVDGDQYGALGEALLTAGDGVTRPLECYVRHDLGLSADDPLAVTVDDDPDPVTAEEGDGYWRPDCELHVTSQGRDLARYYCEVKTGAGGFERNQEAIIEAVAAETPVVVAVVDVVDLPATYEVRFQRYGEPTTGLPGTPSQRTLGDYDRTDGG
jgi:hypothetical protein